MAIRNGTKFGCYVTHCDTCNRQATSIESPDPGEAAELARKKGFTTVSAGLGEPKKWICPSCLKLRNSGSVLLHSKDFGAAATSKCTDITMSMEAEKKPNQRQKGKTASFI